MKTLTEIKYIEIDIEPAKLNKKLNTATLLGFRNLLKILATMMFKTKHAHYLCYSFKKTYRNKYNYIARV